MCVYVYLHKAEDNLFDSLYESTTLPLPAKKKTSQYFKLPRDWVSLVSFNLSCYLKFPVS